MVDGEPLKPGDARNIGATLQKLLPAEVTGTYLVLRGVFAQVGDPVAKDFWWLMSFAIVLAIIFYFILQTRFFNMQHAVHRFFYCICFMVWTISIEVDKIGFIFQNYTMLPKIIAAIVVIVSFVVPFYLPKIASE